ncbi:MAG: sigma-70 family RNA polymerase sigma factor [Caldilinea sp. CFX5]|nr:sigma-70 family RNA polymerase sigma factor [Caldilinea sp. CFX5]
MEQLTDGELVVAARSGDKAAFGQLVDRHLPMARRVAMRMVGNQEIAWELAQEALLQAYLSLDKLREPASFASWLYGIVRNVCRSHLRSRKLTAYSWEAIYGGSQYPAEWLLVANDPAAAWEDAERDHQVQAALTTLSAKNQDATWLFYFEQWSIEEIAAHLGVSVNAVKGRLHQARKQLRSQLAPLYSPLDRTPQPAAIIQERNNRMIRITDLRILQRESEGYALYLLDTVGARVLQMFVGPYEGLHLQKLLESEDLSQSMNYHHVSSILDALGAKLEEVRIESIQNSIFYAVVKLRNGEQLVEAPARPSDALIGALHVRCPIYVAAPVMANFGLLLPQPVDVEQWFQTETRQFRGVQERAAIWRDKLTSSADRVYTQHARTVLQLAFSAAKERNHNYIGTEHLLVGLVHDESGLAGRLLHAVGATPQQISQAVERVGRGEVAPTTEPALAPRTVQVLDYAAEAQAQGGQPFIGSEHLLLGLLREGHGMAMTILRDLSVDTRQLETKLLTAMQSAQ